MDSENPSELFEPVLCYREWWDCPRFGVALVNGVPHYFESLFSDECDEYSPEFELWPIDDDSLGRESCH